MSKRNKRSKTRRTRETQVVSTLSDVMGPPSSPGSSLQTSRCESKSQDETVSSLRLLSAGWRRVFTAGTLIVIAIAGMGIYRHTHHFDIVLDDRCYVMENPFLKSASSFLYPLNFATFATSAARQGVDPDVAVNFIMRPVTYATFYWNRVTGGVDPAGYRVVNIVIHTINGALVFALAQLLTGGQGRDRRRRDLIVPALAALLFTVHPLATESVTYITQRFESLAALFFLAGLCLFFLGQSCAGPVVGWALRAGAVVALIAAMLSKETGVTAPVMILVMGFICLERPWRETLKGAVPCLFLLPLVPALVMAAAWAQNQMQFSFWASLNLTNVGSEWIPPLHYALTQVCASLSYLRLILLPVGQNFDPDYPLITSFLDIRFAGALVMLAGIFAAGWWCHRRWGRPHGSLVFSGILWFFITLTPSSSIVPLPDLFSEHRSYLPSIGIFLALAGLVGRLSNVMAGRRWMPTLWGATAAWVGALALATIARNEILRDDETIYRDALTKSPHKARVWNGLGCSLAWAGRLDESIPCFQKAAELQPNLMNAWKNIGAIYLHQGKYQPALEATELGLQQDAQDPNLHVNRGMALAALGRLNDAEESLLSALEMSPLLREAHLCLGKLYAVTGAPDLALTHYRTAVESGPLPEPDAEILRKLEAGATDSHRNVATGG